VSEIVHVHGRQVLDSRGNPTVEVEVGLESGAFGLAAVPSGASTGEHEAVELRDGGDAWLGKGVSRAVAHVGGEIADAKAAATDAGVPLYRWVGGTNAHVLPVPLMNVVNGGAHAQNTLDFQEFMLVPAGAESFSEALRIGAESYHHLKKLLSERGLSTGVGDEGGFAPDFGSAYEACEAILEAAETAGHRDKVALALDPATSELHRDGAYRLERQGGTLDTNGMIDLWADLCDRFPIVSIEDGLGESDWEGWQVLTDRLGARLQLVGDDLFVTNVDFLRRGIAERVGNAILVKVNQIGTLSETLDAVELAHRNGYRAVISHRSGET
jgi:enolase 1/2/3